MNDNLISQNDSFLKSIQLLDAYNEWIYSYKKRISNFVPIFISDIKIYVAGKAISYLTVKSIEKNIDNDFEINNLNYNFYKERETVLRKMVENHKNHINMISDYDLSWALKSMIANFDKIYELVEKYTDAIKDKLEVMEIQINKEVNDLMKIEEFDYENMPRIQQDKSVIGSLETEETLEELLQMLTK
jgi:HPt (histidine-containing phosphotransfer) domain-containing protein